MKIAKRSMSKEPYVCQQPWPEEVGVQCGDLGLVLTSGSMEETLTDEKQAQEAVVGALGGKIKRPHYRTAFFEAFPTNPRCFIRGEGETLAAAEAAAWAKYQKIITCPQHEFDRRGREDGYAYCRHCPYSGSMLPPTTTCQTCGEPAHYSKDLVGRWYCQQHYYELTPEEAIDPHQPKSFLYGDFAERKQSFLVNRVKFQAMQQAKIEPAKFEDLWDDLIRWEVAFERELEKQGLSSQQIEEMLRDLVTWEAAVVAVQQRRANHQSS